VHMARVLANGQAQRRFIELLRTEGLRMAVARALHYSGLRRR
jgi:hypothetical protein